ncbi:hypothetical protein ACFW9D_08120 [Streptomyces sp. NPDC059524]|uniref:hypothetical protein n=1 Tax=Streptomyces sp. NPDC059524 TaxID=3346856 RepID=UPI0036CEF53C
MLYVGALLVCAVLAAAAILLGGVWHRAGAAVLVCGALLVLPLFAGSALYEVYVKTAGERVPAVVLDTGEKRGVKRTTTLSVCRVVDASGKITDLSEQQNCHGQFAPREHVVLHEDPTGLLDPWVEPATGAGTVDGLNLGIAAALFAAAGLGTYSAGVRRRGEKAARPVGRYRAGETVV